MVYIYILCNRVLCRLVMVFLTFTEVFQFLEATPSSRNISEGQEVLNANHVILVGLKTKCQDKLELYALCLKSSALREVPHEIHGWLNLDSNSITISSFDCSCKAGQSSRCKHIAAVLLLCTRSNILEFELLSCTDLKCYWKEAKHDALKDYTPLPIVETFEVLNTKISSNCKKYRNATISSEQKELILAKYCSVTPQSAVAKHRRGRRSGLKVTSMEREIPVDILAILNHAKNSQILQRLQCISPDRQCCKMEYEKLAKCNCVDIAYESAENKLLWQSERQFRITGSRCYELFTYHKDDWVNKSVKYFWPKGGNWQKKNKYIQHGLKTESEARMCYQEENNCDILQTGLIVCEKHPWLAYSPDGVVMEEGKPLKLLEIKCPYAGKTKPASDLIAECVYLVTDENGLISLKKNHQYYGQVQLGMAILNLPVCDFVVYSAFSKSFLCVSVPLDDNFCSLLTTKLQFVYFKQMIHEICKNK